MKKYKKIWYCTLKTEKIKKQFSKHLARKNIMLFLIENLLLPLKKIDINFQQDKTYDDLLASSSLRKRILFYLSKLICIKEWNHLYLSENLIWFCIIYNLSTTWAQPNNFWFACSLWQQFPNLFIKFKP